MIGRDGAVLCDWSITYSTNERAYADIMQMCYFVTYSRNKIRFKLLTIRSRDWEPMLFFIENNFIYRALLASQLCRKGRFSSNMPNLCTNIRQHRTFPSQRKHYYYYVFISYFYLLILSADPLWLKTFTLPQVPPWVIKILNNYIIYLFDV